MLLKFLLPVAFALLAGCDKDRAEPKAAVQLLTEKSWKPVSTGLDDNRNDHIDPEEESIRECDKDNLYHFYIDGKGLWEENALQCGTGVTESPFTWKLVDNDSAIDFTSAIARIQSLTEQELVIYFELEVVNDAPLKIMTIFRH